MSVVRSSALCTSRPFLPWRNSPQWTKASPLSRIHDHTQTHHTQQDSSGRVINPKKMPLHDNKQHSQQTDSHATSGIRPQTHALECAATGIVTSRLYPPGNILGTRFSQRMSRLQIHSTATRIMSIFKSNVNIGNRTRNLPVCSTVPPPTAPLHIRMAK